MYKVLKKFFIFCTVKVATGDVNITDSAIGAVAGPGAHVGTASVNSQLPPLSRDQGAAVNSFMYLWY